jgi:hypothetical protein
VTWFKVDDSFHAHPKVLATNPAALGLWVVAGAWSSAHLTEGYVPDHALPRLLPDSAELARALVAAGLWRKVRGGHQFHDWTDYNPTADDVRAMREKRAEAGRKGGLASSAARSKPASKRQANGSALASPTVEPPTRPDPTPKEGLARASPPPPTSEPPNQCPNHLNSTSPGPCGPCADARRAHGRWEAQRAARINAAPKCRRHRGQPADNCALCRSEALAEESA